MANAIFFKDGVYVTVDLDIDFEKLDEDEKQYIITHDDYDGPDNCLFGGRVMISQYSRDSYYYLHIDGIQILELKFSTHSFEHVIEDSLSLEKIASFLNAMAANGVDAFLENYKKALEQYYEELKDLKQDTSSLMSVSEVSQDSKMLSILISKLENIIRTMTFIISLTFALNVWMPAALDNDRVIEISDSIIGTYSE